MNNANAKWHKELGLSLSECVGFTSRKYAYIALQNTMSEANYNVFFAHRSNAMFIHISISNVLCTVQSVHHAAGPVIVIYCFQRCYVLSGRVST